MDDALEDFEAEDDLLAWEEALGIENRSHCVLRFEKIRSKRIC